jgi:hypothetical protein
LPLDGVCFQVSATLLYVGRFHACGEIGKVLARCLDCIYRDLPATVLRVQAEDLLNLAELCLEEVSTNLQLITTLFRCISISMRHIVLHDERILKLWFLAHSPEMPRDVTDSLQIALVSCLSEAVRITRLSVVEEATTTDYSEILADVENLCDKNRLDQKLGKRPRSVSDHSIDVITSTTASGANKRRIRSEHDSTIRSDTSEDDGQYSQIENMGGWKLEFAVVQAGIRSTTMALDDMRQGSGQRSMAENGFRQLQSALMVLNLSSCPSAWRHLLVSSSDVYVIPSKALAGRFHCWLSYPVFTLKATRRPEFANRADTSSHFSSTEICFRHVFAQQNGAACRIWIGQHGTAGRISRCSSGAKYSTVSEWVPSFNPIKRAIIII